MTVVNNKKLEDLIESINHISLNQEDLLAACIEFSKIYFKKDDPNFDKFWADAKFIEQSCMCAREAIVLSMNALTLSQDLDFKVLINGCMNLEAQDFHLKEISSEETEQKKLKSYFSCLRKEIFSRVFSQNKSLQKVTGLSKDILDSRQEEFAKVA